MGSFAYTCAISGLPIGAGDKVRYLLLTKNPFYTEGGHNCYIHGVWFPRTFPLRAEYNDYGSIENIQEGPMRNVILEALQIDLIEQGWGENTCHDVPTTKDMTFDELLEAVQEGRCKVSDRAFPNFIKEQLKKTLDNESDDVWPRRQAKQLAISQAMIREDVWDALLRMKADETTLAYWKTMLRVECAEWLKGDSLSRMTEFTGSAFFREAATNTVGLAKHLELLLKRSIRTGQAIEDWILDDIAEFYFIQSILSNCRYQWHPSSSSGPQFGEWKEHVELCKAYLSVARKNFWKRWLWTKWDNALFFCWRIKRNFLKFTGLEKDTEESGD